MVWLPLDKAWGQDVFDDLRVLHESLGERMSSLEDLVLELDRRVSDLEGSTPRPVEISPGDDLQLAYRRAEENGSRSVVFNPGVYRAMISDPPDGFTLKARGEVVVRPRSGLFCLDFLRSKSVTISGFVFDGSQVSASAAKFHGSTTKHTVLDCVFRNAPENGLLIADQSVGHVLRGCTFTENGQDKERFGHGLYLAAPNQLVENCTASRNGGWGFHCWHESAEDLREIVIRRCDAFENARNGRGAGIVLARGDGLVADQCRVWGDQRGIEVGWGTDDCIVSNNKLYKDNKIEIMPRARNTILQNNVELPQPRP